MLKLILSTATRGDSPGQRVSNSGSQMCTKGFSLFHKKVKNKKIKKWNFYKAKYIILKVLSFYFMWITSVLYLFPDNLFFVDFSKHVMMKLFNHPALSQEYKEHPYIPQPDTAIVNLPSYLLKEILFYGFSHLNVSWPTTWQSASVYVSSCLLRIRMLFFLNQIPLTHLRKLLTFTSYYQLVPKIYSVFLNSKI